MQQSIINNFKSQKKVTRAQTKKDQVNQENLEDVTKRKQPLKSRFRASPTTSPEQKKTVKKQSILNNQEAKKSILEDDEQTQKLLNFEKIQVKQENKKNKKGKNTVSFEDVAEILKTQKKSSNKKNAKNQQAKNKMDEEKEESKDEEKENKNELVNNNNMNEEIEESKPVKKQTRKNTKNTKKRSIPKDLLDEIQKINEPSQKKQEISETQKKADEILNQPSLREKYEELTQDPIQLILPSKYKDVLTNFSQLDATLDHFINKGRIGYFDDLSCEIDTIYKRNFQIKYLQQIMFISPNSFDIKYVFNQHKRKHQLIVQYPKNEKNLNLNSRKQQFRNLLVNHTKIQHLEFLKLYNNENFVLQNPNVWHPSFKIDQVQDIPRAPLPNKPTDVLVQSVSEHLDKNQSNQNKLKNVIVQDIMQNVANKEKLQKEAKQKILEEAEKIKLEKNQNKSGLSDNVYKMILAKRESQLKDKMKYKQGEAAAHNNNIVYLQKLVGIINMYYKNRNVCSMALVQVVDQISKNDEFSQMDKGKIQVLIDQLVEQVPEFVSIKINNLLGKCLVVNKQTDINQIKQKLSNMA